MKEFYKTKLQPSPEDLRSVLNNIGQAGDKEVLKLLRDVSKIYYDYHNNGWCNNMVDAFNNLERNEDKFKELLKDKSSLTYLMDIYKRSILDYADIEIDGDGNEYVEYYQNSLDSVDDDEIKTHRLLEDLLNSVNQYVLKIYNSTNEE